LSHKIGESVAHNAIEHAAGLLRIHQVRVDLPGFVEGARMALGVISLNVTRKIFFGSMATGSFLGTFSASGLTGSSGFASFFLNLERWVLLWKFGRLGKDHGEVREWLNPRDLDRPPDRRRRPSAPLCEDR